MEKTVLALCGLFLGAALLCMPTRAMIIDHQCTDLDDVSGASVNLAKATFRVWYGHTSHGSQLTTGMENLEQHFGQPYTFNETGAGDALSYVEVDGDLGHNGDLWWAEETRNQLDDPGNDRNVVIWSWCGGVSDNTPAGINAYLNAMNQLEQDYPGVVFVYMTGHLDGTGAEGNLHQMNELIRDYCRNNGKLLYDFADIESYDPDGNFFMDRYADDNCDYDGGNWATEWCDAHPGSDLCWSCDCAHSQPLNCNLKGRAFWYMVAWMAENFNPGSTPTPGPTPGTPTPTPGNCSQTGVSVWMPDDMFSPGDPCSCSVTVCNREGRTLDNTPLFVVLDVYGTYFFGPGFTTAFDNYLGVISTFPIGATRVEIIPEFYWPDTGTSGADLYFYAAITNPQMTELVGELGDWRFGWE